MAQDDFVKDSELLPTGVPGLDDILRGGLTANRLYLVEGDPGAGKTTLALQFLLEGARRGETGLYITLSETERELRAVGRSHGWDLNAIHIRELVTSEQRLSPAAQLTIFHPSEVELGETTEAMLGEVEKIKPQRLVLDSLSEVRLVAQSSLRYRRQILALKQFFAGRLCTVLLLDDRTSDTADAQLQSIAHGVISLQQLAPVYGSERRMLRIIKMRGQSYRGGIHDFVIRRGGLDVYPRLVAAEHHVPFDDTELPSGNESLDLLLGGGLPRGTSTLLLGPAGAGKSTVAIQFAVAAALRGERSAVFALDENLTTLETRSRKIGMDLAPHEKSGLISLQQVNPAELSPGEFATAVRRAAEGLDGGAAAKVVIIDSLNGYLNAMPGEKHLNVQLHELLSYLGQRGVMTLMTLAQSGIVGAMRSPLDTTYLADNVILFRYFETRGEVRRAVSVMKKRTGPHERTIREMTIGSHGISIGEPLTQFQGVLNGVPILLDRNEDVGNRGPDVP